FTSIDVLKGRGPELARFDLDPGIDYLNVDISPDGTRLAMSGNPKGPIHILNLRDHSEQVIPAKFNNLVGDFHWAADGKGLYVPDQTKRGTEISYLEHLGKAIAGRPSSCNSNLKRHQQHLDDGELLNLATSRQRSLHWPPTGVIKI